MFSFITNCYYNKYSKVTHDMVIKHKDNFKDFYDYFVETKYQIAFETHFNKEEQIYYVKLGCLYDTEKKCNNKNNIFYISLSEFYKLINKVCNYTYTILHIDYIVYVNYVSIKNNT